VAGDFAKIAHWVISKRPMAVRAHEKLTVKDVNDFLDVLAAASNEKERKEVFRQVYNRSTADEQYWFIRIVVKGEGAAEFYAVISSCRCSDVTVLSWFFCASSDLRIGMKECTILKVYHVNAFERYEVNTNLRAVCTELTDPAHRIPPPVSTNRFVEPHLFNTFSRIPLQISS
jgi:hypothetical protein